MERKSFPLSLGVLVIIIAVIDILAVKFYLYWSIPWLDMLMHFAGGVWLGGTVLWYRFFSDRHPFAGRSLVDFISWALAGAFCFGILWEFYEAAVVLVLLKPLNPLLDSLSDIGFDTLGGLMVAIFAHKYIQNKLHE